MKAATVIVLFSACFLCFILETQSAPAPSEEAPVKPLTFWDQIFNIPRSVLKATGDGLNKNGVKCKNGEPPVEGPDGKGTCHDNGGLGIAKSAIDSVNDFLNG